MIGLGEFTERGVIAIIYPPHTENLFQVLGVIMFGRLKSTKKYIPRNDYDPAGIDHLVRIFETYEWVSAHTTIGVSWMKAEFESYKRAKAFYL
jgi:hypothetical protein